MLLAIWAQRPHKSTAKEIAIQRAKNMLISTFDSNLPDISLEYFLKYESNNALMDWDVVTCDEHASSPVVKVGTVWHLYIQ